MAIGEEALVDQLNLTIEEEEASVDQTTPHQLQAPTDVRKAVFKAGLVLSLISIASILNPPITATVDITHSLLLCKMFHVMVCVSLAIGVLLILLSTSILHRIPRLIVVAKPLTDIGWALATITLGYGSSLVLMASSSPWFYHPLQEIHSLPTKITDGLNSVGNYRRNIDGTNHIIFSTFLIPFTDRIPTENYRRKCSVGNFPAICKCQLLGTIYR